jgi:starch synthase (maltosyl-transferring)
LLLRNPSAARKIYYAYPSLVAEPDDWDDVAGRAAELGFDAINVAASFSSIFSSPHANHGAETSLEEFVALARSYNLKPMTDLRLDRISRTHSTWSSYTSSRIGVEEIDPRVLPQDRGTMGIDFHDQAIHEAILELAFNEISRLSSVGISGFRCVHLNRTPASFWRGLIERIHAVAPDCLFLGAVDRSTMDPQWLAEAGFNSLLRTDGVGGLGDAERRWRTARYPDRRVFLGTEGPFERRLASETESPARLERLMSQRLFAIAAMGDGLFMPMGFEFAAREKASFIGKARQSWRQLRSNAVDLSSVVMEATRFFDEHSDPYEGAGISSLPTPSQEVEASARIGQMPGHERSARVVLVNTALDHPVTIKTDAMLSDLGEYLPFGHLGEPERDIHAGGAVDLGPGGVLVLEGASSPPILRKLVAASTSVAEALEAPRLVIENITPVVDGGLFPVRQTVGEIVGVEADAFGEGHDPIGVALKWRAEDEFGWRETIMRPLGNDRWTAEFPLERVGRYFYTIEAWRDEFAAFRSGLNKKNDAGQDVHLELREGIGLVEKIARAAKPELNSPLIALVGRLADADQGGQLGLLLDEATMDLMRLADPRAFSVIHAPAIPVDADRRIATFASWYELFPRSQSNDETRHGTFDDVVERLPAIRDMGFDVVYFPPIHPIGTKNRKGRNNSLVAGVDDHGSPYAIGSEIGGHDAIHPDLGTLDDFRALVSTAAELDMEIALDLAIQASPNHPWLREHPEWFDWRPDGTIRYAENPPKKYEDIVNVHFYNDKRDASLWLELLRVVDFWVEQGVKLFRVDNPHTKPLPFWEWLIDDVRGRHPDVVFLSEAFTRPKLMYRLAKVGFSQSYTYFTWRNTKWELTEYMRELTAGPPKDIFRPHFFVNTHDINPDFLQDAPRSAYLIRAALATTLSGLWGMYNGFELCEGRPDARRKEYADSEKYQLRAWDWDRPGNIIKEITRMNAIRRDNTALHSHLGIEFLTAWNDNIIYFEKATRGRENVLLIAINLDPHHAQEADIEIPTWKWSMPENGMIRASDLMRGHRFNWFGKMQHIRLDPAELPFSIWRISPSGAR